MNEVETQSAKEQLIAEAKKYIENGKRVIPCHDKRPLVPHWNKDGDNPSYEDVKRWIDEGEYNGIGVVCGSLSKNEYVLDFENEEVFNQFKQRCKATGMRVPNDTCKYSSGKGYHLPFRCDEQLTDELRPTLAKSRDGELLIELLGEKCFCVRPPSLHPNGNSYEVLRGDPHHLPHLTKAEAERLIEVCKSFHHEADEQYLPELENTRGTWEYEARDVIERFNQENNITNMLEHYGYKVGRQAGYYRHPNNDTCDSVHILDGGKSYHFGANDPMRGRGVGDGNTYYPFNVYVVQKHNGDIKPAIKTLSKEYGMDGKVEQKAKADEQNSRGISEEAGKGEWELELIDPRSIKMERQEWLWDERIPKGGMSVIYGNGGTGKSHITYDLVRAVTTGGAYSDGTPAPTGKVIFVSGEENLKKQIVPIMIASGADLANVRILRAAIINEGGKLKRRNFTLADVDKLKAAMREWGEVALIIIDPIGSYMNGKDSYKDAEVREILDPLQQLAEETNSAVVIIGHTNKSKGGKASHKIMGSAAFYNLPRAAFYVDRDPNGDGSVFTHAKAAGEGIQPSWTYSIQAAYLDIESKKEVDKGDYDINTHIKTSRIQWGDRVNMTADDLVMGGDELVSAIDEVVNWLSAQLSEDEKYKASDIIESGKKEGYSHATIHRAAEQMGVKKYRSGYGSGGVWVWRLPNLEEQVEEMLRE